ncbi:hypothetical protein [Streptantibioticus silvisoli]|uniref:Uncharacterized protein n=1 Tax=Streptantibioticus silvisoli TaxID=2705255 RepID=A0ABT6VYK5_9ACTN|nr:hypothetical protein [Streptantibioticus silvisoli]MDI5963555.1 hypothetical protein [Streptantibioticus silvisoli]
MAGGRGVAVAQDEAVAAGGGVAVAEDDPKGELVGLERFIGVTFPQYASG